MPKVGSNPTTRTVSIFVHLFETKTAKPGLELARELIPPWTHTLVSAAAMENFMSGRRKAQLEGGLRETSPGEKGTLSSHL